MTEGCDESMEFSQAERDGAVLHYTRSAEKRRQAAAHGGSSRSVNRLRGGHLTRSSSKNGVAGEQVC